MTPVLAVPLGEVVHAATQRLAAAGVPSPRHDAEVLAAHLLGLPRGRLAGAGPLSPDQRAALAVLVERRAERVPLQHLTGEAPFRHLLLAVGPGVFVPRPESEGLVDLVLPAVGSGSVVVDLGAGSGAIALAIATERPGSVVHAVEMDPAAAAWLNRNVAGSAVIVHQVDLRELAGVVADVVVSNPPYLPLGTVVDPEVADHDPPIALWGGSDGLDMLRAVVDVAGRLLRPGGLLALEHDLTHQGEVLALVCRSGFSQVLGHVDLAGRNRYVTAVRAEL